ncbi:MAG: hypothetical protein IT214_04280 [Chitinophagaceae bacterium]|nr:hypothetical protein [Chitinophagaceae bacterium]
MNADYSRRLFLKKAIAGIPFVTGIAILAGSCNNSGTNNKPKDDNTATFKSCDDLSGLSAEEKDARIKLHYVDKSPVKSKMCRICTLYIPAKEGMECGGCTLLKGPIHPEGTCIYFTPKEEV